jgi:hypothetical protein
MHIMGAARLRVDNAQLSIGLSPYCGHRPRTIAHSLVLGHRPARCFGRRRQDRLQDRRVEALARNAAQARHVAHAATDTPALHAAIAEDTRFLVECRIHSISVNPASPLRSMTAARTAESAVWLREPPQSRRSRTASCSGARRDTDRKKKVG